MLRLEQNWLRYRVSSLFYAFFFTTFSSYRWPEKSFTDKAPPLPGQFFSVQMMKICYVICPDWSRIGWDLVIFRFFYAFCQAQKPVSLLLNYLNNDRLPCESAFFSISDAPSFFLLQEMGFEVCTTGGWAVTDVTARDAIFFLPPSPLCSKIAAIALQLLPMNFHA